MPGETIPSTFTTFNRLTPASPAAATSLDQPRPPAVPESRRPPAIPDRRSNPPDRKPNDLGYFIGYQIAQAYYEKARDKRQALREIITARNGNVRELLAMSGYAPR